MWWYSAASHTEVWSANQSQWSALWYSNTTLKPTLFSNWGLHCSHKHASPLHFAHSVTTTTETYKTLKPSDSIFRNANTRMKSCHWAFQTINSGTTDAPSCWSKVKGQKVLPEHNEFSIFDWHFGWRRRDVFLIGGEHGCSVCGGGGFCPLPMWTQHNHTHSALSSVSSSSPLSSSSSLQQYKTEKETCKKTVKRLFLVML